MQRFCHNCGDQVEDDEIFCDNCGTKLVTGDSTNLNTNPMNNQAYNYNNNNQMNRGYKQVVNNQYSRPAKKNTLPLLISIGIAAAVVAVIGFIVVTKVLMMQPVKKDTPTTVVKDTKNNTDKTTTDKTTTDKTTTDKPTTDKPASGKSQITWSANIQSYAKYSDTEKKIDIYYTLKLANGGSGKAANVRVYLNPAADDQNAQYLGITAKTIVNADGPVAQIGAGEENEISTQFFYDQVDASLITQDYLQTIANTFLKIPLLVEWQENGTTYTQSLVTN